MKSEAHDQFFALGLSRETAARFVGVSPTIIALHDCITGKPVKTIYVDDDNGGAS